MTKVTETRRARVDYAALSRLIKCNVDTFEREYWAKKALLSTEADRHAMDFRDLFWDFHDVFSLEAADELLSSRALRTPFIRMAKNGKTLPESAYTVGGGVGAGVGDQVNDDAVQRLFAEGATVVLQGLHRTWAPITRWSQNLAGDLGHPVQVNAYITPEQSQGFSDHYDVHDVFVLQIHGAKQWSIHEPVLLAPLRDQPWSDRGEQVAEAAAQPATIEAILAPGDTLYLPRGYIHSAKALGGVSIHLTVGVHGWTRHHLAEALLAQAKTGLSDVADIRTSLPLGVDVSDGSDLSDDIEVARRVLIDALKAASPEDIARTMAGKARAAQRPESVSPIASVASLARVDATSQIRLRDHLLIQCVPVDGSDDIVIRSRVGRCLLPSALKPTLDVLRSGEWMQVTSLDVDEATALEAAKLFITHGIAIQPAGREPSVV